MRSASERLAVLESLDSALGGVSHTWDRLREPRRYMSAGLLMGGGLLGSWLLSRMWRKRVAAPVQAQALSRSAGGGSAALYLLVQVVSALALPWVKSRLEGTEWSGLIKRYQPSSILFRWLGLEK